MHHHDDLKRGGFSVVDSFLNQREVVTLCNEINALVPGEGVSLRNGRVFILHIEFSDERLPGGLEWYGH